MTKFAKIGISLLLAIVSTTSVSASTETIEVEELNDIVTYEIELSPDF